MYLKINKPTYFYEFAIHARVTAAIHSQLGIRHTFWALVLYLSKAVGATPHIIGRNILFLLLRWSTVYITPCSERMCRFDFRTDTLAVTTIYWIFVICLSYFTQLICSILYRHLDRYFIKIVGHLWNAAYWCKQDLYIKPKQAISA